mgnify:CR=1 FL=1
MITLLHASPILRGFQTTQEPSLELLSLNNQTKIPTFCKSDILESLGEKGKVLNMKFEILTQEALKNAFDINSRILYIGSEVLHPDGLILEDAQGRSTLLTYKELKKLFNESKFRRRQASNLGKSLIVDSDIEMVIVGTINDEKLANFLVQELQVKHVIYFKFDQQNFQESYRKQMYEAVYVTKFVQNFLCELISGHSVQESFENSHKDSIDCLADSFFSSSRSDRRPVEGSMNPGAILLPVDTDATLHSDRLFGFDDYILQDGKLEDVSTRRPPSNVRKTFMPFFGRVYEMDAVVSKVLSKTQGSNDFIMVQGAPGSGKSRFVLEAAYYLLQRSCFKDGIFYIPLRKLKSMSFIDILENTINPQGLGQRISKNSQSFFRNKEMLLIFDDFDLLYSDRIAFPSHLFNILKRSKVKVLVTCAKYDVRGVDKSHEKVWEQFKEKQKEVEAGYIGEIVTLNKLEDEHLARIVVALTSTDFDGINEQELLNHPDLAHVQGIPKRLIDRLREDKVKVKNQTLQVNPYLLQYLDLDKRYSALLKNETDPIKRDSSPNNLSRYSKSFVDFVLQLSQKYHTSVGFNAEKSENPYRGMLSSVEDSMIRLPFDSSKGMNNSLLFTKLSKTFSKEAEKSEESRSPNKSSLLVEERKSGLFGSKLDPTINSIDEDEEKGDDDESVTVSEEIEAEGYRFPDEETVISEHSVGIELTSETSTITEEEVAVEELKREETGIFLKKELEKKILENKESAAKPREEESKSPTEKTVERPQQLEIVPEELAHKESSLPTIRRPINSRFKIAKLTPGGELEYH